LFRADALNLLGVDVAGLDAAAFFRVARTLYPFLALAGLLLSLRVRRPGFLLLGVLLACGYAFFVTHWPLQSLYGLLTSNDRVANLALGLDHHGSISHSSRGAQPCWVGSGCRTR
jgi:hypothetical protein